MKKRIAIVGTGPTGIYCLQQLLWLGRPLAVEMFEKADQAGIGMPFSPETSSKSMLANIASIEIPPVVDPYLDWLRAQPEARILSYGLDPEDLDDRQFTPRLLLGEYFRDQLLTLAASAVEAGQAVAIHESTEVLDILTRPDGLYLRTTKGKQGAFDRVVLATGHDFPDEDEATRSYYPSPWSGLIEARLPAVRVGIMGTSLSSIDAVMAVVNPHGRFRREGEDLRFDIDPGTGLHVTLMSRSGILPEADFYCPIPYQPLSIMTEAALADCASAASPLDAVFDLVRAEILHANPASALRIVLAGLDADGFAPACFAARQVADPFRWARENLEEVERNKAARITVSWRYALLRMHEQVEKIIPDLPDADRDRFDAGLKKVFVDNYAAVPSESIRRLLALRDAGIVSILPLGEDYDLAREPDGTVIRTRTGSHVFEVFIDARGQKALKSGDLPFPSLRDALLQAELDIPEVAEDYSLVGASAFEGKVSLASIPLPDA